MCHSANDVLRLKLFTAIFNQKRLGLLAVDEHRAEVHVTQWHYIVSYSSTRHYRDMLTSKNNHN